MAYKVEWAPLAKQQFDGFASKMLRLRDEGLKCLEWGLNRKPYRFEKIGRTNIRMARIGYFFDTQRRGFEIRVFFKLVDPDRVEIQWVESHGADD